MPLQNQKTSSVSHIWDYLRRFWAKNALKMPLRDHFNRETNSNFFYTNMGIDTRI